MSCTWTIVTIRDQIIRRHVIVNTIAQLMHANLLEVFNQRDHELRRAAIAHTYADDIRWTDDDGVSIGRELLDARAAEVLQQFGHRIDCTSCHVDSSVVRHAGQHRAQCI